MNYTKLRQLRRLSQIVFLALFLLLLFKTEFRGSFQTADAEVRLSYPISIFLESDPLLAVSNALATGSLYSGMIWSLLIILPTFFLGRFFCGWVCPLGTLNHLFSSLKSSRKRGRRLVESNRYQSWQTLKYYILAGVLVAALFGSQLVGIVDPISLSVRSLSLSFLPSLNYGLNAVIGAGNATDSGIVRWATDLLRFLLKDSVLSFRQPYFSQAFFLGSIFIAILACNLVVTRFWCRALCPLGALLGVMSRWSVLGMEKSPAACDDCNVCLLHCQGGDDPIPGVKWRKAECHLCLNCVGDCPESGIDFRFFPDTGATDGSFQLQRRVFVTSLVAGVAVVPLLRSSPGLDAGRRAGLIRPPGALDEKDFLGRCVRCGECMKVCPNNALQPTLFEAGLEGIWTPTLVPRIGYCEPSCVLCGQVCPTGAIWEITQEEKLGVLGSNGGESEARPVKLGTAFIDRGRCLPWAMATECIVCEEWCPTSPKAVYLRAVEVMDAEGRVKEVRQPYVDPERCTGCGACEYACPVRISPAVYVTSIGESRSEANRFLLKRGKERRR